MSLQRMWSGLDNVNVIEVESHIDCLGVVPALMAETDCVILCGHGTPSGLRAPDMCGIIVGDAHLHLLRDKTVIGIWCYAAEFADYNCLSGFFSSMFISDAYEARAHGYDVSRADIDKENNLFADRINDLLKRKIPISE